MANEEGNTERQMTIPEWVEQERKEVLKRGDSVLAMMKHPIFTSAEEGDPNSKADYGEMRANIMLAYRHLEDARMRLGKVFQAHDGGESAYKR